MVHRNLEGYRLNDTPNKSVKRKLQMSIKRKPSVKVLYRYFLVRDLNTLFMAIFEIRQLMEIVLYDDV